MIYIALIADDKCDLQITDSIEYSSPVLYTASLGNDHLTWGGGGGRGGGGVMVFF